MKKLIAILLIFISTCLSAQSPESFNYQAALRDTDGVLLTNQSVSLQLSIRENSTSGAVIYQETFVVITSSLGLVNVAVGTGTSPSGAFSEIDWSNGPFFLETGLDQSGGSTFVILGASQLMSVPYALYAKSSGSSMPGPQGPQGEDGKAVLNGPFDPISEGTDGDFYLNTTSTTLFGPKASGVWGAGVSLVGQDGTVGEAGTDGADGADGVNGADGTNGIDGRTILSGGIDPTTEGQDGDFFINTSSNELFGPKAGGWGSGTSLIGAAGADGSNGTDGKTILSGVGAPTSEGVDGDFYFDSSSSEMFGPKSGVTWGAGTSLVGSDGNDGVDGSDGSTILNGTIDPTSEGVDGDFYLNTATSEIFGPKAGGTWGTGTGLIGAPGSDGLNGNTILNGTVNPTSEGVDGDFYLNTTSNEVFGPKAGGAWGSGTSLVGASGSNGADGRTVLNGTVDPTSEGVDGDFYLNTTSNELFGPKTGGAWSTGTSLVGPTGPAGADGASGGNATYRWATFHSYVQNLGQWAFNNDPNMFGGVAPSNWTDGAAIASDMSSDKEVLRTLFQHKGYAKKNAMILNDEHASFSSTNGKVAMVLLRIRNTTGSAINWSPHVVYSGYSAWGERASAALNGAIVMNEASSGISVISNLSIPPNRTSTFILVSTSGAPTGTPGMRLCRLGFISDTLDLPAGLEFVDDLDTATGGWEQ